MEHQGAGMAFARVTGVRADGADFVATGDAEAFACHGDQFSVLADAEVVAHFVGLRFVEAWKG